MSSNQAIVNRVECYMDELLDCFEGFVKKSLLVITIGLAAVIGMLMYMMRMLTNRSPTDSDSPVSAASAHNLIRDMDGEDYQKRTYSCSSRSLHPGSEMSFKRSSGKLTTGVNTTEDRPLTKKLSFDEKVLKDIGLSSCSKYGPCNRTQSNSSLPCRNSIPCMSPHKCGAIEFVGPNRNKHVIPSTPVRSKGVPRKGSCCSTCCNDEKL